jgi:hypothetical protein
MLLDKWVSYDTKVGIAVVCAGMWIYFRTESCYNMIPRQSIFPVVFVMGWTYLNYSEPLFLPIGLSILVLYAYGVKLIPAAKENKIDAISLTQSQLS